MSISTSGFVVDLSLWLIGPILGLVAGVLAGLVYRLANAKVDTNTNKPALYHKGIGIAVAIGVIGYIVSYNMFPASWQYVNMEEFSIRTAVSLLFYAIFFEITMITIANKKQKGA